MFRNRFTRTFRGEKWCHNVHLKRYLHIPTQRDWGDKNHWRRALLAVYQRIGGSAHPGAE
jgi:hypothetical protein